MSFESMLPVETFRSLKTSESHELTIHSVTKNANSAGYLVVYQLVWVDMRMFVQREDRCAFLDGKMRFKSGLLAQPN